MVCYCIPKYCIIILELYRSKRLSNQSPRTLVTSSGLSTSESESEDDENQKANTYRYESPGKGFDDDDMEKPNFKKEAPGPKIEYVLSEDGVEPIVQVMQGILNISKFTSLILNLKFKKF